MAFIPWGPIIGGAFQGIGNLTNKEWRKESPGGEWVSILTGGASGQFMPSSKRAKIETNWMQDAGRSIAGDVPGATVFERRVGDTFFGEGDEEPNYGFGLGYQDVRANPPSQGATAFGSLINLVPWGNVFGSGGGFNNVGGAGF